MPLLRRTEELILLTILQLGNNAYGVTIRRRLQNITGERFSYASIYVPLERLTEQRLLRAIDGEPTSERGGRRRRYFRVTKEGMAALADLKRVRDDLRQGVPGLASA